MDSTPPDELVEPARSTRVEQFLCQRLAYLSNYVHGLEVRITALEREVRIHAEESGDADGNLGNGDSSANAVGTDTSGTSVSADADMAGPVAEVGAALEQQ